MEKQYILGDVATFCAIAAVASLFGFSHINPEVTIMGRAICGVAMTCVVLSLTMKRSSSL